MEKRINEAIKFFNKCFTYPDENNETAYVLSDGATHIAFDEEPCHGALRGVVGSYLCKTCSVNGSHMANHRRGWHCEYKKSECGFNRENYRNDFKPLFVATHKLDRETRFTEIFEDYIVNRSPIKDYYIPSPNPEFYVTRCDVAGNEMLFALQMLRMAYGESLNGIPERFGSYMEKGLIPEGKEWMSLLLHMMYEHGQLPNSYSSGCSDYLVVHAPSMSRMAAKRFLNLDFITKQDNWNDVWLMDGEKRRTRKGVTSNNQVNNSNLNPIKGVWALFHPNYAASRFHTKAMKKERPHDYYCEYLPQVIKPSNFESALNAFEAFIEGDI